MSSILEEMEPSDLDLFLHSFDLLAGPIQFVGPASNVINHTLLLELGAQA